ncbi:SIS domain-containing protein [Zhihengliuella halotolerans]|uniref:Fructoselysine-6-P-deglycase FrlB-like protein n=1 Tax=Zhihengliuella halotolerans TaxID=370736 RepID=A0A4Q8AEY3_9MICC|nr:SIS domain-containing protein [Zhihengliuella halotolerans]RZU62808.1 fructoselysine-6-P-deglycase FrlB-like protein [Zhihengliuella halotolerans]
MQQQNPSEPGAHMRRELLSQPELWRRASRQAREENLLPHDGARVAVVGCGTSWFMAHSYAVARETGGRGLTDAFAASEAPDLVARGYDAVVAITRSGTTTEVLELLRRYRGRIPTTVLVGDVSSPATAAADAVVALPYADEQSVVQTRFATSALVYLLTSLGQDVEAAADEAARVLAEETPAVFLEAEQFTFLGTGWTVGLAHEAGLKMREAVQGWTESYPAMEYRHGPISIAAPGRVVWLLGDDVDGLSDDVAATEATFVGAGAHPLAALAGIHRIALDRALARGLDPDSPRSLTRSVILEG